MRVINKKLSLPHDIWLWNELCRAVVSSVLLQPRDLDRETYNAHGGGRTRLPKFKFSAKFPIGLHVILQIQIKKFENDCYIMWKNILTENPSRFNVEPLLK